MGDNTFPAPRPVTDMGSSHSLVSKEELAAYKELTYFSESEIKASILRFCQLLGEAGEGITNINDPRARVRQEDVISRLQELRVNPFADRICAVFAHSEEFMVFEEFLDMISSLSESAPTSVKAEWAFRMFDYDGDRMLGKDDIRQVLDAVTGSDIDNLEEEKRESVVRNVLNETDLNRTGKISLAEFKQLVVKSPDFANNFRIRL